MGLLIPARSAMSSMAVAWKPFSEKISSPAIMMLDRRSRTLFPAVLDLANLSLKNGISSMPARLKDKELQVFLGVVFWIYLRGFCEELAITVQFPARGNERGKNRV